MGSGSFDSNDWSAYSSTKSYSTKTTHEIFELTHIDPSLNPKGVDIRESRDSSDNPITTPIIAALDVTGSMGKVAGLIAKEGLPIMFAELYNRKPVLGPQIMFMGIGDIECDEAPLQVSQFESDIRIAKELEKIYLEGGGGGNNYESYALAWYFAARHTSIDSFEKRGKKGYLFTFGDEFPTPILPKEGIKRVLGDSIQENLSMDDLLTEVSRQWEVFHIIVEQGDFCKRTGMKNVLASWKEVLGQRVIPLSDYTKLSEVVVSTIQVCEGVSKDTVVKSWDGSTGVVVSNAISGLTVGGDKAAGVVTL